jgi:hypothetical protein
VAEKGRIFTGARARFLINGVKVGYARNVNLGDSIEYQPIEVLDNIEVEEHVPVAYRVDTFTASTFRIVGETLKTAGWFPKTGGDVASHLENILITGELTATIEDSKTKQILATVEQVKISAKSLSVDARGVAGIDVTFVAIRVKDESEV